MHVSWKKKKKKYLDRIVQDLNRLTFMAIRPARSLCRASNEEDHQGRQDHRHAAHSPSDNHYFFFSTLRLPPRPPAPQQTAKAEGPEGRLNSGDTAELNDRIS